MMNLKQRTSSKESLVQCGGGRVVAWLCICSAKVTRRSIEIQSNAQPERHFLNYKGQGTAGYWWAITKHMNPVNKRMCLNGEVGLNTFHYLRQKVSKTNRTWKHLKPNVKILKFFLGFCFFLSVSLSFSSRWRQRVYSRLLMLPKFVYQIIFHSVKT